MRSCFVALVAGLLIAACGTGDGLPPTLPFPMQVPTDCYTLTLHNGGIRWGGTFALDTVRVSVPTDRPRSALDHVLTGSQQPLRIRDLGGNTPSGWWQPMRSGVRLTVNYLDTGFVVFLPPLVGDSLAAWGHETEMGDTTVKWQGVAIKGSGCLPTR